MCWSFLFVGSSMLLPVCHCGFGSITSLKLCQQPSFQSLVTLFTQELIPLLQVNFLFLENQVLTYPPFVFKYVIAQCYHPGPYLLNNHMNFVSKTKCCPEDLGEEWLPSCLGCYRTTPWGVWMHHGGSWKLGCYHWKVILVSSIIFVCGTSSKHYNIK